MWWLLHRAGQWKWANPWEVPKRLLLGLKEETKGAGAAGTGRGRAFVDEEQHVPRAREEHRNSPARIERVEAMPGVEGGKEEDSKGRQGQMIKGLVCPSGGLGFTLR